MRMNASVAACTVAVLLLSGPSLQAAGFPRGSPSALCVGGIHQRAGDAEWPWPPASRLAKSVARSRSIARCACWLSAAAPRPIAPSSRWSRWIRSIVRMPMTSRRGCGPRSARRASACCRPSCRNGTRSRRPPSIARTSARAASGFKEMLDGLADPDIAIAASQSPLADLKTLAVGFYELSSKALVPLSRLRRPSSQAPTPGPPPTVQRAQALLGRRSQRGSAAGRSASRFPPFPGRVTLPKTGVLELVIDDNGNVESAMMRVPVNAQYDRMATTAAKNVAVSAGDGRWRAGQVREADQRVARAKSVGHTTFV